MLCSVCKLIKICKLKQFVDDHQQIADIVINRCQYFMSGGQQSASAPAPGQVALGRQRTPDELNEVSDKIKQFYSQQKMKNCEQHLQTEPKIVIMNDGEKLGETCRSCGNKCDKIQSCVKCGKDICDACGIFGADNKNYCEECWESLDE